LSYNGAAPGKSRIKMQDAVGMALTKYQEFNSLAGRQVYLMGALIKKRCRLLSFASAG
jgi:hypothetical protein